VLVAESNPDALADAIAKALASPAVYEGMSRQAIATASQYSLETWRQTIGALLTPAWAPLREGP
jgi:glycosyltransferase involved in cell wall biosynthesis